MPNIIVDIFRRFSRVYRVYREMGFDFIFGSIKEAFVGAIARYFSFLTSKRTPSNFRFQGKEYRYFYHPYNTTWRNERAIEVPIIWRLVCSNEGKKILEVGNVLSHYFKTRHEILDKYENAKNVVNEDITNFHSPQRYNLIVSISTIEHVGWFWYDDPQNYKMVLTAFKNLINHLYKGGKLVVTIPVGYNPRLDHFIKTEKIRFDSLFGLKRISIDNKWIEVGWKDALKNVYGKPFPGANGIIVGIVQK